MPHDLKPDPKILGIRPDRVTTDTVSVEQDSVFGERQSCRSSECCPYLIGSVGKFMSQEINVNGRSRCRQSIGNQE
jgi:hypothetical protein